jgi:hypothetical protein
LRNVSLRVCVLSGLLALAGCSELGPTEPQGPGPLSPVVVEVFNGSLALRGSAFYSFSVETSGTTFLTLVDARENGVVTEALITIGLGVPRGTQCVGSNILSVKPGGAPQVSGTTNKGVHCAIVFDPGNLTSPATFSLNIARPQ